MNLVYIAGKYRGDTPWDVEQNIRNAESWALKVAQTGNIPICTQAMYRFFDKQMEDKFWIAATLEIMKRCDIVLLIPGWEVSVGARDERVFAEDEGMTIVYANPNWDREELKAALKKIGDIHAI
jgi:hypothetical protein